MMSFLRPITWLRLSFVLVVLSLLSGGVWAQDEASQQSLVQAQEIRLQLKQLSGQLARLRQTSTQADQKLSVQVQGVHQQIEQLERKQADLIERLQTLQTQHEQNQADHLQHQQQLVKVLWGLAGLGGLMLLTLWRLRSPRAQPRELVQPSAMQPPDFQPTAPEPPPLTPPMAGRAAEVAGVAEALATPTSVAPSPVDFTSPFLTAPADLAEPVFDSSSTEQVLAKGLQGFMQPVQIKR